VGTFCWKGGEPSRTTGKKYGRKEKADARRKVKELCAYGRERTKVEVKNLRAGDLRGIPGRNFLRKERTTLQEA